MPNSHTSTVFPRKYTLLIIAILSIFIFNGNTGCGTSHGHHPFIQAKAEDYSNMGWLEAYDALHTLMQKQYAFGEWKNIDWNTLNKSIRPKIIAAETIVNQNNYATALLEYTRSLPDGHVTWGTKIFGIIMPNIQGCYNFGIAKLDNNKVIVTTVTAGSQAALDGMIAGDEILEWNDTAINTVATQTSTLWRPNPASMATTEHSIYEQYRALTLDPALTKSKVKFSRADGTGVTTNTYTAADDGMTIQDKTKFWNEIDDNNPITYKVLPSGYGYIMLGTLESDDFTYEQLFDKFKEAMEFLTGQNVPGIIIDLRANGGGSDDLAAKISGFFYSEQTFYEYQNLYNAYNEQREILLPSYDDSYIVGWGIPLNITPQSLQFTGPVVAIVNPDTVSSAEGVAMTIQNLPNGYVVSIFGTNGSFGMTGGEVKMPLGYQIKFPNGQSLNENKIVQLDSRNGIGGITPDIRVARTSPNMINYVNRVDVELAAAVSFLQSL